MEVHVKDTPVLETFSKRRHSKTNHKGSAEVCWEDQRNLALRKARTMTQSADIDGIVLHSINKPTADTSLSPDLKGIKVGLNAITANGGTAIGTQLCCQIRKLFVCQLLVSVVADSGPGDGNGSVLAPNIVDCGNDLSSKRYLQVVLGGKAGLIMPNVVLAA
ncbi:hypothetical protein CMQ_7484 [Grosmannia clavigera kw1407]|uniref:Uncharacterized protein n=1 Tax=Grosmannia clavigera (strain kw1407 / UAMH 11150) TaxID=655863 RepID=F0XQE3_GROCL|nr:uncharacterized protein CMQ_7484 [Grosmannia clavigera kw1407]EFX00482.1 hypothetical protein CMQ_7484 [Grosmannia clavigera kw1407]